MIFIYIYIYISYRIICDLYSYVATCPSQTWFEMGTLAQIAIKDDRTFHCFHLKIAIKDARSQFYTPNPTI